MSAENDDFQPRSDRSSTPAGNPDARRDLVSVIKVSEYREHARECRELASKMDLDENREQMLSLAAHWEQLARDREDLLRRHPELDEHGEPEETEERRDSPTKN